MRGGAKAILPNPSDELIEYQLEQHRAECEWGDYPDALLRFVCTEIGGCDQAISWICNGCNSIVLLAYWEADTCDHLDWFVAWIDPDALAKLDGDL
jgi:hypothetical protein